MPNHMKFCGCKWCRFGRSRSWEKVSSYSRAEVKTDMQSSNRKRVEKVWTI